MATDRNDQLLSAIHDQQREQNTLLARIADKLDPPTEPKPDEQGRVQVAEPAAPAGATPPAAPEPELEPEPEKAEPVEAKAEPQPESEKPKPRTRRPPSASAKARTSPQKGGGKQ